MPIHSKVKEMHSLLQKAGADVGDLIEFNNWFFAKGQDGYNNRKYVFDTFKQAGADVGENYEDFANTLGLQAVKPGQANTSRVDNDSFNQTIKDSQQTLGAAQQTYNRIGNRQQRIGLDVPKGDFGRITLGENRKVTPGQQYFNSGTGQMENTYITEQGNEYEKRGMADLEQNAVDLAEWERNNPKEALKGRIRSQINNIDERMNGYQGEWVDADGRVHYIGGSASDEAMRNLDNARHDLNESLLQMERSETLKKSDGVLGGIGLPFTKDFFNNWKNFGYAVWDRMSDVGWWEDALTGGVNDLEKAGAYLKIKDKLDKGIPLSDQETNVVLAGMATAQAEQFIDLPLGYTAGGITADMAPFMAQIAFNPAGGLGSAVARQAVRKFGRKGLGAVTARVVARVLGNAGEAAVLSNTLQAPRTIGNVLQRYSGDTFLYDEDGNLHMGHYEDDENGEPMFVEGGKGALRSAYEGEVSSIIENFTELGAGGNINKFLKKIAASKAGRAFGIDYLSNLVGKVGSTPFAKSMKKFMERTHWDGMIEEPLEEEYGIILNSLLGTGENKISDLWDSKEQAQIFAGTLWFGGMMSAMNTAAYPLYRRQLKKRVEQADIYGQEAFGQKWNEMKGTIDAMEDKQIGDFLYGLKDDSSLTKEQKAAAFGYAARLKQYQGANVGDMLTRMENNLNNPEKVISNAYEQGAEAETPDEMKQYNDEALAAEQNLYQYGEEFAKEIMASVGIPVQELNYLLHFRDQYFSDEQIAAAADYFQKRYRAKGMMEGALDRIDLEVEKANAEVRANTHQQTGSVVLARGNDNMDYYIIGGNVVLDPETGIISLPGTGGALVVKDQFGNVSVKSPQDLMVYSMQPSDELINTNETVLRQQLMQQADEDITYGSPANEVYQLEDTVALNDGQGNIIEGEIGMMPNSVDGVYVVYTPDGKALQFTADQMNRMIVAHNGQEVQRGVNQNVNQNVNQEPENAQMGENYAQNQPENIQGGNLDNAGGEAVAENGNGANNPPATALSRIPVLQDEQGQPILNKKGKPQLQWHKASVEDAAAALIETTGGDKVMARDTANDLYKQGQEKLEKIRKQKPKGDDPIEMAESRMAIQKQIDDQQAINKQWQDVNLAIQKQMRDEAAARQAEIEAAKSEAQRKREAAEAEERKKKQDEIDRQRIREQIEKDKEKRNRVYEPLAKAREEMKDDPDAMAILSDTEPRSLDEWVSSLLRPHSLLWQDASPSEVGLQSELGLKRTDMQRFMTLLGNKESNATPFGKAVLDIYEALPEGMKNQYTDEDVRNTLLNLFNEGSSTRMMHLTEENRIEEARETMLENMRRDAEAEMLAWAEANHLTPEERETYEDFISNTNALENNELDYINQIIADEEQNQRGQGMALDNSSGTAGREGERGESQVQRQGATETAGAYQEEPETKQGAETPAGVTNVPDTDVPGGAQGVETFISDLNALLNDYDTGDNGYLTDNDLIERARELAEDLPSKLDLSKKINEALDVYDEMQQAYRFENGMRDDDGSDAMIETLREIAATKPKDNTPIKSQYDSFEDLVADTHITVKAPEMKKALRKIVDKMFLHGSSNNRKDPQGFEYKFVYMADGTTKADRNLLKPWENSKLVEYNDNSRTATWVDEDEKRIYFIKYNPPGTAYSWDFIITGYKSLPEGKQTVPSVETTSSPQGNNEGTTTKKRIGLNTPEGEVLAKGGTKLYTKDGNIVYIVGSNIDHAKGERRYTCSLYENDAEFKNGNLITKFTIGQQDMRNNLNNGKYSKQKPVTQEPEQPKQKLKPEPKAQEPKRLVSDERMEELAKLLRNKLGGQATMGVDPEILSYGVQMGIGYLERGVTKLADFTKKMIQKLGEAIRPYIDKIFNKAKEQTTPKTAWWSDPNRPKSIDRWDYRTYMTDEAKEYFANYVGPVNEKGEHFPDFKNKWAHPNLAYITAAAWDGANIPLEELMLIPEIQEAEVRRKKAKGSLNINEKEQQEHVKHLLDAEHGSAVYVDVDGKKKKAGYSGPVRQDRKAFIVIGRPAGGKSSVFTDPLSYENGARIIDSDVVKPWLKGYDEGYGAGYVQNASAEVANKAMFEAAKNGDNMVIPRIGGSSVIEEVVIPLREMGYDVQLYWSDVSEDSSIMRAASRFAQEGRYLSLEYLTGKGAKISNTFRTFAEKKLGDYYATKNSDSRSSERADGDIQDVLARGRGNEGREEPARSGAGTSVSSLEQGSKQHDLETAGGGQEVPGGELIFSYAEWKSNDVSFGEKPKEIWNSKSGQPMPIKEGKSNGDLQSKQGLSRESGAAGEGAGQTSGSADRTGAERGHESNRAERSGRKHSVNRKRIVSDARMEELKKRLKSKLLGQLNVGVDPEILAIGAELAVGFLETDVIKFSDFAKGMISKVGDVIRPYIKSFYNAVRDMPEAQEYASEMDDYQTVSAFDVNNFDKQGKTTDALTKAQQIVDEQKVRKDVAEITDGLDMKETTINDIQDETDEQTAADTEAIVSKAEAIAGEARSAKSGKERTATIEKIDKQLEKIEDQLAFIGFYDVDPDAPYHESMGRMKSAEKKAVADATKVARQLAKDLGIDAKPTAKANMAPIGGDITFRIPINDNTDLYFDLLMERGYESYPDSLEMDVSYFRLEDKNNKPQDNGRYKNYTNHHFGVLTPYNELLDEVRQTIKQAGIELAEPKPSKQEPKKASKKSKQQTQNEQPSLFDMMFFEEEQPANTLGATSTPEKIEEEEAKVDTNPTEAQKEAGNYQKGHIQIDGYDITIENPKGSIRSGVDANGKAWEQIMNNTYGYIRGTEGVDGDHIDVFLSDDPTNGNVYIVDQVNPETGDFDEHKVMYGFPDATSAQVAYFKNYEQGWKGFGTLTAISREAFKEWIESSHRKTKPFREYALAKRKQIKEQQEKAKEPEKYNNLRNNVGERGQDYAPASPKARFNANVEAIKLMRQLIDDVVEAPTKEQMDVLRKYSGWGGMGTYFNDDSMAENKQLRELLSEEEYNDAVMSINSAYYTPTMVIDTLWDVAKAMGFKGGNILEGSAGIGNIIGQMPRDISRRSNIEAVEIDTISGNILKLLYPDAKVNIEGFQDVKIPNGTVDLAITNVPFVTGLHVIDKVDKDLSRKFTNIHDFCIAKNIRKLREGGIGIFITSSGTMDKSTKLRQWIPDEGQSDVVGVFRLNNETFGGTNVTSDIIVVRKRVGGVKSGDAIDISKASPLRIGSYENKYGEELQVSMVINDYFKDHPEMMAGEMFFGYEKGDTYRAGSYGLYPAEGKSQEKMMQDFVKQMKKVGMEAQMPEISEQAKPKSEPNQLTAVKEGRMLVDDNGRLCVSRYGTAVPLGLNDQKVKGHTKQECFKDYQEVQKAVDDVLLQQLNDPDDAALKPKLDALNKAYDKFTKRYGTLHKNTAISFLRNDIDFPSFQALENYSESKDIKGKVKIETKKAPLFTQRVLGFKTEPQPENIKDAVTASIFRSNTIDTEWISDKLGKSVDDVKKEILESRIGFEDPSTGQMEIRYKYLSGNVREKLAIAEGYNTDGKYAANVEELRKAVPMDIPSHLIDFSLGSSWIPNELYKDYIKETLGLSNIKLTHVEGAWVFDPGYNYHNEKNRSAGVYSDKFRETIYGHQLVSAALNNRPVKVMKQVTVGYGDSKHTETRVDQAATSACAVRVDEIKDEFKQWAKKKMQDNPELSQQIEKIYNEKFNALVPMQIDDEFLPERFEGSNVIIKLRPYQKRGAIRGLTSPTMLAHEVGTGKTFTLITTAMEMRRLGTAKKPMIVVQNATVPQITADAKLLYPNAKVLSLTEKDRNAEGRRAFYASIKYNDWDMIIIPQSTLNMIPDSPERELQFIQEKIDEKKHVIEAAEAAGADSRQLQQMKKELDKLEQEYGDTALDNDPANNTKKKKKKNAKDEAKSLDKAETKAKEQLDRNVDDVQYFDDLGVDALLVDEAHEYKHLGFQTSIGRGIKGIDPSYSKKCAGLYNKTRAVFEKAGWKNVVFATGTPISNTAAEIWTFMKYLMQPDVMRANDIYYFDDFVHNFGNISQMLEFATSGKFKENTRFASYVNKPELIRIWTQVADIVLTSNNEDLLAKIPKKEGGQDQDVFLPQSPSLVRIMAAVRAELERFENMSGKEKKENSSIPITMYGIAKRAAIDPRLVDATAPDEPMSKTNAAVKEIVKDLKATEKYKGTVAVFCDNQNRKGADGSIDFNIYEDMRDKLIKEGVPAEQIAIIKSGMSMTAKQKVFDAVNAGDIRVVFGSTQTLGTGVNMQERLHMLIHMDAPDRPMDYTQRNGRIERQGNLHKEWGKTIRVLRFGVEDSLDVTAYQRLKTKSGFIDSIMKGEESLQNNQVDRTIEEEEEGLFDNPVAVLSGSQYALKKNQAERELRKYQGKKNQWENDQIYVANTLRRNKSEIEDSRKLISEYEAELARYKKLFPDGKVKVVTVEGETIDLSKGDADAYVKMVKTFKEKIQDPVNATVKKLRENPIYNDESLNYTVELDGHPVNFRIDVYRTSEYENGKMKTVLHKATYYKSADLQLTSDVSDRSKSARECVEDIMNEWISGNVFNERIDTFNNKIDRLNAESELLQKRVGMEFQFSKELEKAKKDVEEYTELMKKEMEEKEAKYAAQQKEAKDKGGFDLSKAEENGEDDNLYRSDDDVLLEDNPIFYSNAMQAVEAIKMEKATPDQWLAMIVKNGGLKAGEDKWLGLSDYLEYSKRVGGPVYKQELIDFIRDNEIEIEETHYTEGYKILEEVNRRYPGYDKSFIIEEDDYNETPNYSIKDLPTAVKLYNKHHTKKYQITIDSDGNITDDQYDNIISFASEIFDEVSGTYVENPIHPTRYGFTTNGLENKHEIALTVPTIEPWGQGDTVHFGDAGEGRAVAWVRFGETTTKDYHDPNYQRFKDELEAADKARRDFEEKVWDGKPHQAGELPAMNDEQWKEYDKLHKKVYYAQLNVEQSYTWKKVLVIDEIQSKRHQEGRRQGYKKPNVYSNATIGEFRDSKYEENTKEANIIGENGRVIGTLFHTEDGYSAMTADGTHMTSSRPTEEEALKALDKTTPEGFGIPDAPFEKNWHELAMKRMLRYAAENGFDKIAWTTGAQQADRYNVGKVISSIGVSKWGVDVNGYNIDSDNAMDERGVFLNVKGKDNIALEVNRDGIITYDGDEGYKGHHLADVIGKDLAQQVLETEGKADIKSDDFRIGDKGMKGFYDDILPRFMNKYGKKWGVSVKLIDMPKNVFDTVYGEPLSMWSVDVTPQMKESVMLGQPMFRDMEQFIEGETFPIYKSWYQSSYNVLGSRNTYSTDLMPDEYQSEHSLLDALRNQYPEYYVAIEDGRVKMQTFESVMADAVLTQTAKKAKGTESYVERKTKRAIDAVESMAKRMKLDVEVLTSTDGLTEKQQRAKGWFNKKTHKIYIVLPNHRTQSDVINTLLHEGVAHYGLRKMFGEHFDTFLDNVYNNVDPKIKDAIDASIKVKGWSRHEATEEYLARLAERTDFEHADESGWWRKIKDFFINMLAKAGFNTILTDNELRYILWRSYDNLLHPNDRRNIFDTAREIDMQNRLKVGPYEELTPLRPSAVAAQKVAEPETEEKLNNDIESKSSEELLLSLSQKDEYGRNETINELIRRIREGDARIVRMGQEMELDRGNDAQIAGAILGGWEQLGLSSQSDGTLRGVVQGRSQVVPGSKAKSNDTTSDNELPIISWAKATGHYYDEEQVKAESLDKDVWDSGIESRVYRTADGKKVIKFVDTWSYYENPLLKRMDGVALQNSVGFEYLNILGYSIDKNGRLMTVIEQKLVDGVIVDDMFDDDGSERVNNYIDAYLENVLGLESYEDDEGNVYHRKGSLLYKDIHGGNMLVDSKNNRHIIDCLVEQIDDEGVKRGEGFIIEDEEQDLFSIRTKEPPKKTGIGYKVFVLKDGQLYPPMVANPNGDGTPVGVWLDADAAPIAGTSKTGRPQVKAGGKGTQGGSGQLAYRPGWHLGTIPYALQFNRKDASGEKTLFPNNFVWAEVEYADDVDYQDEARKEGMNANGKYQHSLAGLKHVPTDGSYKYRTNPDPRTDEWVITGAMRVNKILSREEVDELVRKAGREPQPMQEGDVLTKESLDALNEEIQAMKDADEMGLLYRDADDDVFDENYDVAREIYEKAAASDALKFQEAWQDKMAGLKILQNAIEKETGKKATGAEDAYLYENRMHGKAKNQSENYDRHFYRPLLKAANAMMKAKGWTEMRELTDYMVAKHGLERNIFYAFKETVTGMVRDQINKEQHQLTRDYEKGNIDALTYKKEQQKLQEREAKDIADKIMDVYNDPEHIRMKNDYEDGFITYSDFITNMEDLHRKYAPDFDEHYRDYSGLTELTGEEDDFRNIALAMVDAAEKDNQEPVKDLWDAINAATKETLRFAYESGTMSRSTYNNVRAMFDYYVPLRGWEEDNADDFYDYVSERNVFSTAIKKAYGRKSLAENPLAYIGNMAVSTLLAGHKNLMKQHFLNYVMNNPTSLVSVSEKWWENKGTETSPYWVEVAPEIPANATADEISDIVEAFNEDMKQKAEQGKATTRRGNLSIKYHATGAEKNEHMVEVLRAGKTYQLYVNGNPKAAQALNGINEKAVSRISQTDFGKFVESINRSMAAFFTSKNPAFVLSNLSRDLTMAGASVAVKEDAAYNAQFIKNVIKVLRPRTGRAAKHGFARLVTMGMYGNNTVGNTGLLPSLMRKYLDGDLDLTNETERLFGEFMDEGGETGFVNMLSVDSFKEKMQKEIGRMQGTTLDITKARKGTKETPIGKGLRLMGEIFEFYNRCAEDATRFIVYMTSRQMGKSLEDSIADAKDVTLNFNRKGTGAKWNAVVRDLFIFVNPAVQALANMFKMAYKHPLKLTAVTAAFVAGGAIMPILNQWLLNMFGDDDDKEAYWNLPPWVRKNNLVLWIPGTKNFITIPLAQEFRVFYGLGEMISSLIYEHPVHNWPMEILSSFMDLVPINPTGNGGNLITDLTPTMFQPMSQLAFNTDFTGKPIWKENQGNKYAPMYTKAYITTPEWMVGLSETMNDLTGGNEGKKGWIEEYLYGGDYINNPAVWNHLMQGYFGGMYNTIAKTFDVGVSVAKNELPKVYQTPILNRFLNRPVERDNAGVLGEEYYQLTEERDRLKYELRTWQKKADEGDEDAQAHIDEIKNSDDYQRMLVIDHYDNIMKDLKAGERAATQDIDKADIKESITMYKAEMMEELAAIDGGEDPLTAAKKKYDEATTFAERNRLRMRIEKLMQRENETDNRRKRGDEVTKALSYREDEERESRQTNETYLELAKAEAIEADARIRIAKQQIKQHTDEYKRLVAAGAGERAAEYRNKYKKYFAADAIIQSQSRNMATNKKLLGKGHDAAIMKLIDSNRQRMLKAIEGLE